MHLKTIELVGFKSFAGRTKLSFDPGMSAIVGPNGCGKSNISDAIRWVLGEQSAKALRGAKMEDVIFGGTDKRKALGMAEVSITFTNCESALGTDFHEVTVTRRVLRSGEGQYFINRRPCRLKDVKKLFMDTGVGTNSYSLMEQGRIDMILSARPEDRRLIFEEASGITGYKAARKEALRKLDYTEANLLRLDDVVREVKRQIGSLQRQAGKARRYKTLQEELRSLDLYVSKNKLKTMDDSINTLESSLADISKTLQESQSEVGNLETKSESLRSEIVNTERSIGQTMEEFSEAQVQLNNTKDRIRSNRERIAELTVLSERDHKDIHEAERQATLLQAELEKIAEQLGTENESLLVRDKEKEERLATLSGHEKQTDDARRELQSLRAKTVDIETRDATLQNELIELESREKNNVLRRERLSSEQAQLSRVLDQYKERQSEMEKTLSSHRQTADEQRAHLENLTTQKSEKGQTLVSLQSEAQELTTEIASLAGQIRLLTEADQASDTLAGGAKTLLSPDNPLNIEPSHVIGLLADHLSAEPGYEDALQAIMRSWSDAIVLAEGAPAIAILQALSVGQHGPVRLLRATSESAETTPSDGPGSPLLDHVQASATIQPMLSHILESTRVVSSVDELPAIHADSNTVYVSKDGVIIHDAQRLELWLDENSMDNPLARKTHIRRLDEAQQLLQEQLITRNETISALTQEGSTLDDAILDARRSGEEKQREVSIREGEAQVVSQETNQAADRLETVTHELKTLNDQFGGADEKLTSIAQGREQLQDELNTSRTRIEELTKSLGKLEELHSDLYHQVTEARIRASETRQRVDYLNEKKQPIESRLQESQNIIKGRTEGIESHQTTLEKLTSELSDTDTIISGFQETMDKSQKLLDEIKNVRIEQTTQLNQQDHLLAEKRRSNDSQRDQKGILDVNLAESRLHRENMVERVTSAYTVTMQEIRLADEPDWENDRVMPDKEIDRHVTDIRKKLDAMGPVNLVAIDEYQELEERFAFLTAQHNDLNQGRLQLLSTIKELNNTSAKMFTDTFERANENFQLMFKQLFDGGNARLELVDGEDVLESGIDIVARPPGKKLQTVSLLSGGERTMTAVSLLFAIYMIKPSPFCVLDEIDAALDESNINRFVSVLQGFVKQSQFVIITHSRQTIAAAEALYGVTMQEKGVSRIVSMKFKEYEAAQGGGKASSNGGSRQKTDASPTTA